MGKPISQRQKEYLCRLKENNNEEYLKKEKERKKVRTFEENTKEYESKLQKGRERKKMARALKRKQVYMLK